MLFCVQQYYFSNKKIKDYQDSKIKLRRYQVDYGMSKKDYTKRYEEINDVYNIEDVDIPPKFKSVDFNDDCLIYCLYSAFKSNMIYYINFAEIKEDISYFISFIIDKSGNVKNINIRSRHDKVIGKGRWLGEPVYNQELDDVFDEFSEVEADIVKSILELNDDLLPGIKDGENVNTELKLEVKLITK